MGKEQVVNWYSIDDEHSWLKVDISRNIDYSIYANCYRRDLNLIDIRHDELITLAVF